MSLTVKEANQAIGNALKQFNYDLNAMVASATNQPCLVYVEKKGPAFTK